jgi:hypothetical protein
VTGPCWHCGGMYPLKRDGTLRKHRVCRGLEWVREVACSGSGQTPRDRIVTVRDDPSQSVTDLRAPAGVRGLQEVRVDDAASDEIGPWTDAEVPDSRAGRHDGSGALRAYVRPSAVCPGRFAWFVWENPNDAGEVNGYADTLDDAKAQADAALAAL